MLLYRIKYIFAAILVTLLPVSVSSASASPHELNTPTESRYLSGEHAMYMEPVDGALVLSMEAAEMLKIEPSGSCSDHRIISVKLASSLACKYEEPGPFESVLEAIDGPQVMVSLGLDSTRLGSRAMRYVDRNTKVMSERIPVRFTRYLARSTRYLRMMKNILREEGVPEDIAYLPLIESGFYTHAYSRSRASGPWQFISSTGRRYGLKIDWWVDERRDPVKSTRAAARYLRDLHEMFDSWSLALAGYNAGEGKIKRALKVTKAKDFWSVMRTMAIKRETFNYVPKFIAARQIAIDPESYGFSNIPYQEDFTYDEVTIEFPMSLDVIARISGSDVKTIKDLNAELRRWSTPPVDKYNLKIPRGSRETFLANLPKIPEAQRVTVKVHIVRYGDTVSQIAHRYGVPQRSIITYNRLSRRALIRPGQRLIIPVSYKTSSH